MELVPGAIDLTISELFIFFQLYNCVGETHAKVGLGKQPRESHQVQNRSRKNPNYKKPQSQVKQSGLGGRTKGALEAEVVDIEAREGGTVQRYGRPSS